MDNDVEHHTVQNETTNTFSNKIKVKERHRFNVGEDVLQYFENMNWDVVERTEYKKCMNKFLPIEENSPVQSHSLRLINSQLFCFPEKKYDLSILEKNENVSEEFYVPGVTETFTIHPQYSVLSKKEQGILYLFLCRNKFKNPPPKKEDFIESQNLMRKGKEEYEQFQQFVQYMWIKSQFQRSLEIPASVLEYINKLWPMRMKLCADMYPTIYKTKANIPLSLYDPNEDYSVMEFNRQLFCKGGLERMLLPNLKKRCEIVTDLKRLCQIKPFSNEAGKPLTIPIIRPVPPVSVDPLVETIIQNKNIDVVITCSGIKCIVDVYNLQKNWILPITVKNVSTANGQIKKVVIIDKCLPPSAMSTYDKNVWHAKLVSKWALIPNCFFDEKQSDDPTLRLQKQKLTQYDCDDTKAEVTEEFGVSVKPSEKEKVEYGEKYREKECTVLKGDSKEEVCGKLENLHIEGSQNEIEEGEILAVKPKNLDSSKRKCDSPEITQGGGSNLSGRRVVIAKRLGPKSPRLVYKVWDLHKSTHFNMSKQEQRQLKILVRNRVDGSLAHNKSSKRYVEPVYVSSKLEYQPEYGASIMSISELVREYVDVFIRQINLCRVRTVGHTKELMMFEVLDLADVKETLKRVHGMETQKLFNPLYAVLTKLIDLPVGRYMLNHTSKMGVFAELLAESQQHCNFNLATYCDGLKENGFNLPAAQIDPFTLTKVHFRDRYPPGLFQPGYDIPTVRFLGKRPLAPSIRGRRKKKKQRQQESVLTKTC